MASETCSNIIDWLSDVEASAQLNGPSLSGATSSPHSSPCLATSSHACKRKHQIDSPQLDNSQSKHHPKSPCFVLKASPLTLVLPSHSCLTSSHHSRKRKQYPDSPQPITKPSRLARSTRRALADFMGPSPNKRRRNEYIGEVEDDDYDAPTEQNTPTLRISQPSLSSQSNPKTPVTTKSSSSQSNPKTPGTTKKAQPTLAVSAHNIHQTLAKYGMRYDDTDAYSRCSNLKAKMDEIITSGRNSARSDNSIKKAMITVKKNYTSNEDTLHKQLNPLIIKVKQLMNNDESDFVGGTENLEDEFKQDSLQILSKIYFVKKLLPGPDPAPDWKGMGLTEPRPDLTYGIAAPHFPPQAEVRVPPHLDACLNVAPGVRFPFYIEEHKSAGGTVIEAEHQAMRDGAVLVNARMKLNEELQKANYIRPIGADLDSFVFSCAWTPDQAKVFCNWFEKLENGEEVFHMTKVRPSYAMDRAEDIRQLSHDLHNILDWGFLNNRPAAQRVWDGVVKKYNRGC